MPMYNLLKCSSHYSDTTNSSWLHSKDEATHFYNDIADTNDFKSFKDKTKLLGGREVDEANGILRSTTIVVPLKCISSI